MTTVTDLLDRAHTLLAKSSLTPAQYNPISELLIQAKAELMAAPVAPDLSTQSNCRTFLLVNTMRRLDKRNTIGLIIDLVERLGMDEIEAQIIVDMVNRQREIDGE